MFVCFRHTFLIVKYQLSLHSFRQHMKYWLYLRSCTVIMPITYRKGSNTHSIVIIFVSFFFSWKFEKEDSLPFRKGRMPSTKWKMKPFKSKSVITFLDTLRLQFWLKYFVLTFRFFVFQTIFELDLISLNGNRCEQQQKLWIYFESHHGYNNNDIWALMSFNS